MHAMDHSDTTNWKQYKSEKAACDWLPRGINYLPNTPTSKASDDYRQNPR